MVPRLYSTRRCDVLSLFADMKWLYRLETSVVGGGTTNQSETDDRDGGTEGRGAKGRDSERDSSM